MQKYFNALKLSPIRGQKYIKLGLIAILIVASAMATLPAANLVFSNTSQSMAAASKPLKKLPIYSVDTQDKKIAISFDAAWGADDTDNLLKILADEDVKATFFLCGYWVSKYPEEVKRIYAAGHDIGNHGNTHAHGAQISKEKNKEEIIGVHEKIKNLLGIEMNLFRPPFGEYNNNVIEAADELGYHTIQWDVDTIETKTEII